MKAAALFLACLALVGAAACRGGDDSREGGSGETERIFTNDQVHRYLERELDLFNKDSEAGRATAVVGGAYWNLLVFKPGVQPTVFRVAAVRVPPTGEVAWSEWKPYTYFSGQRGKYTLAKNYGGNVALIYDVEATRDIPPTELPRGFLLVDQALSKLTGVAPTTAVVGINAP